MWAHAYDYYEGRRKAEQVMFDQMRWVLADPQAHDLIPVFEQQAADDRAQYQPVVAKLRDDNFKDIKGFQLKYLHNGCLTKAGTAIFTDGIRDLRASFKDIYKAHEQLFRVNLALQTAQMDLATQCMQDADLEAATIEENWQRSWGHFMELRFRHEAGLAPRHRFEQYLTLSQSRAQRLRHSNGRPHVAQILGANPFFV